MGGSETITPINDGGPFGVYPVRPHHRAQGLTGSGKAAALPFPMLGGLLSHHRRALCDRDHIALRSIVPWRNTNAVPLGLRDQRSATAEGTGQNMPILLGLRGGGERHRRTRSPHMRTTTGRAISVR